MQLGSGLGTALAPGLSLIKFSTLLLQLSVALMIDHLHVFHRVWY